VPDRLLIEARPGAGKTTALGRLAERLSDDGVALSGFLTREMRDGGRRVGFEIETFAGERGLLAHVDIEGPPRVSRYGVDLEEFERLALPALEAPRDGVVLIDELGKMELASVFASARPSTRSSRARCRSRQPYIRPGIRSRTPSSEGPTCRPSG
jgi:nucleoside-triphosphatase